MNPLLEQFLSESKDFLQGIGEKLMQLEDAPNDSELMDALFRLVHTFKGNSGLFEFPELTRVLHAAETLMDAVREREVHYSRDLADRLLDAMDFVGMLCDSIADTGAIDPSVASDSARLSESLMELVGDRGEAAGETPFAVREEVLTDGALLPLSEVPEAARIEAYRLSRGESAVHWVEYVPEAECFFQGDDPLFQSRKTPKLVWSRMVAREAWAPLAELDCYRCNLNFHMLAAAARAELVAHFRFVADQVRIVAVPGYFFALPTGSASEHAALEAALPSLRALFDDGDVAGLRAKAKATLEAVAANSWAASALRWLDVLAEDTAERPKSLGMLLMAMADGKGPDWSTLAAPPDDAGVTDSSSPLSPEELDAMVALVRVQRDILSLPREAGWQPGRIKAVAATLAGCLRAAGRTDAMASLDEATEKSLAETQSGALVAWLDGTLLEPKPARRHSLHPSFPSSETISSSPAAPATGASPGSDAPMATEGRTARPSDEGQGGPKSLKVDQAKIDRLMNLIGEMVVSKNALPYLAARAETVFGSRDLSKEIKAQYAVINRIAEEMQDAIMQVRMMPVSFVFQRFPRLVRDTSRKLGKDVQLVLEGEDTEADKLIIESLGDPLVHIVRNSLDHGFELPEVRQAAGKPATGTLLIRAAQEADRVVIDIRDDGRGIDPEIVKRKAYEKGLIEEDSVDRLSDQEAIQLIFAPGFSTAEVVSDLSGRGVGMDAVKTAIERVNGSVTIESKKGHGTSIRLSLPLSMAVTNVMIIESAGQRFGVPLDSIVETVRVPRTSIKAIKREQTTVLRGRIVPLRQLNTLLAIAEDAQVNEHGELAVLVVRLGDELLGLLIDDFHETVDIILKPMTGVLGHLGAYAGSALMGDGSILMVLNVNELIP